MDGARPGAVLVTLMLLGALAVACGAPAGPQIRVEDVWARPAASMDGSGNGAAFMLLRNGGDTADRLVAAQSAVANTVEIHETTMDGGVMKMRPVVGGIEVPAGAQVELKPGGYHVMLIGLTQDLQEGDRFQIVLRFEKSGPITVEAEVRMP